MQKHRFDTKEWLAVRDQKFAEWLGDESAVQFAKIFGKSLEVFDDLLDRDKPVTSEQVFYVMYSLWAELPFNTFWNTHKPFLVPLLLMTANAWMDSNDLEDGEVNDRVYAYTLRNLSLQVLPLMVYLLHGPERMREVSLEIHHFFTEHETLDDYLEARDRKAIYARPGKVVAMGES